MNYPSEEFAIRMFTVYRFVETVLTKLFNTKKITEDLVIFLTPHLTACSNFFCKRGKLLSAKHNEQFVILIRWKLIKPIIKINGKTQRYLQSIRHQQWGKKMANLKYNTFARWFSLWGEEKTARKKVADSLNNISRVTL